jgi:predicted AlkP superfamily pyrophosphatase or phosphodiesterase
MTRSLGSPALRLITARGALACVVLLIALPACGGPSGDTLGAGARKPAQGGTGAGGRVVVVCIDGMMPETYLEPDRLGLKIPTLRSIVARGVHARAVEPVFPTVTYPSHTSIVTGAPPGVHGIVTNRPLDPLQKNYDGWRWYTEDIAVPTLWSAVEAQGRAAALVTWPVTVGARASFVVPEYWRSGSPDDQKLLRSLSTPGLLDKVALAYPDLWKHLTPPNIRDRAQIEIAKYLVTQENPDLVLVHVWETDDAQHDHGPRSQAARAAFEHLDQLLGELLAALERSPDWSRTTLVVLSDHGFAPVEHEIRLNALFRERGLVQVDAEGKATSAKVAAIENGGTAYVYVLDPAAQPDVMAALESIKPAIGKLYSREEIAAAGGDPKVSFAVGAAPGYAFHDRTTSPAVANRPGRGHHGFPPSDPAMAASFLAIGPRLPHRDLGTIRMIDIGPTIARWLGVTLSGATGTAIPNL